MLTGAMLPSGRIGAKDTGTTEVELKVRQRLRHDGVLWAAWSPDGSRLVSGGHHYSLWNPLTGEKLHELAGAWPAFVVSAPVRFTADDQHVVVVSDNAKIDGKWVGFGLWNVETGQLDRQIPIPTDYFTPRKAGDPWFFSVPGKKQAIVAFRTDRGQPVLVYDTESWKVVGAPLVIPEGGALCLDASPDGSLLAIGNRKPVTFSGNPIGRIELYDIANGTLVRQVEDAHKGIVGHVAFSRDGSHIASAPPEGVQRTLNTNTKQLEDMRDVDSVRVWNVSTGEKAVGFGNVNAGVSNVQFHPTAGWLGASVAGTATAQSEFRIWNLNRNQPIVRHRNGVSSQCIAFSPNGRFVAMAGTDKWGDGQIDIAEIVMI